VNIYVIERREDTRRAGPDEATGFVVAATDNTVARKLAAAHAGDEGPTIWQDPAWSSCSQIGVTTTRHARSRVVLRDFRGV
jgi:hypothetical protein